MRDRNAATNGRLPWLTPDELDDPQRGLYERIAGGPRSHGPQSFRLTDDAGRLHGPFNAMLFSPDVGTVTQELGSTIRYRTNLSGRAREIAILELAVQRRSDFEWYAHERVGRAVGLTDDELESLLTGTPAPSFDVDELLVRDLVRALVRDRDLDDEHYTRAREALGTGTLMDVITLVGYYDLLALSLRVCRTALPAGAASPFTDLD